MRRGAGRVTDAGGGAAGAGAARRSDPWALRCGMGRGGALLPSPASSHAAEQPERTICARADLSIVVVRRVEPLENLDVVLAPLEHLRDLLGQHLSQARARRAPAPLSTVALARGQCRGDAGSAQFEGDSSPDENVEGRAETRAPPLAAPPRKTHRSLAGQPCCGTARAP